MTEARIAIIGGGLAGLYAAYRLHRKGIAFDLFEARKRLGGRILATEWGGLRNRGQMNISSSVCNAQAYGLLLPLGQLSVGGTCRNKREKPGQKNLSANPQPLEQRSIRNRNIHLPQ